LKKDDPMGYMKIEEEYFDLACFIASQFFRYSMVKIAFEW
jgi:hypothetical protein